MSSNRWRAQLAPDNPLVQRGRLTPIVYRLNLADPNSLFLEHNFPMANRDLVYVSNSPSTEVQKVFQIIAGGIGTHRRRGEPLQAAK